MLIMLEYYLKIQLIGVDMFIVVVIDKWLEWKYELVNGVCQYYTKLK
jgi:hypothetical protein